MSGRSGRPTVESEMTITEEFVETEPDRVAEILNRLRIKAEQRAIGDGLALDRYGRFHVTYRVGADRI